MNTRPPYPFIFVLEETRSSATITHHVCIKNTADEVVAFQDFPSLEAAEFALELLAKVLSKIAEVKDIG